MKELFAYHVVTDHPMHIGQHIIFDKTHHSGVYKRVIDKSHIVNDIYSNPHKYIAVPLEHHTSVALRELALEEVRRQKYPSYPSRMNCLYVSSTLPEAEKWYRLFIEWGRPTYQIVKLKINGNIFTGDANNCFTPSLSKENNRLLAEHYWQNFPNPDNEPPIHEVLADGDIEVIELIKVFPRPVTLT